MAKELFSVRWEKTLIQALEARAEKKYRTKARMAELLLARVFGVELKSVKMKKEQNSSYSHKADS